VRRSIGLVLMAGTSVQFGAAVAVHLFDRIGPGGTVFLRLGLAAVLMVAVMRPHVRGRSRHDLGLAIALGVVLGFMNWSFYESLDRIPLGAAVTIEMVGPLSVGLAGSRKPLDLVWIVLAALGVLILADPFGSGGLEPAGVALAALAGACWAAYILLTARTGRVWSGVSGLAFGMGFGALVALPAGVAQGGADLFAPAMLAGGLFVACASSIIPYSLEMHALRRLPEHVFGVLMSLEPALAATAGFIILGQDLQAGQAVAIALVVAASSGVTLTHRRRVATVKACPPSPSATVA
jgi:inner membrane transporter RhtA